MEARLSVATRCYAYKFLKPTKSLCHACNSGYGAQSLAKILAKSKNILGKIRSRNDFPPGKVRSRNDVKLYPPRFPNIPRFPICYKKLQSVMFIN